jgi:hypothetical protein
MLHHLLRRRRHRQREKKEVKAAAAAAGQQGSSSAMAAAAQPLSAATVTPAQAKHKKEYRDSNVVCLSTEIENGNVEYKYCLSGCVSNPNRRHQLVSCLACFCCVPASIQYNCSCVDGHTKQLKHAGTAPHGYPSSTCSSSMNASSTSLL